MADATGSGFCGLWRPIIFGKNPAKSLRERGVSRTSVLPKLLVEVCEHGLVASEHHTGNSATGQIGMDILLLYEVFPKNDVGGNLPALLP
jgi:hypothetical protein